MTISVRAMRPEEARRFLEIHHEAVRGLAARDYRAAVVEAWAPRTITDDAVTRLLANHDGEIRLVAELQARTVGIGALVTGASELRACYVIPSAARRGVGTAIVAALEQIARERGLDHLRVHSSLTAEPFYRALGYEVEARGTLTLAPGISMTATDMRKRLV